ncbi:DUF3330 domain-containing protein [Aliikangiella sp. IMCC44359]|uniref:DUF3330 domain-containing protein n=1 Tax=Aliikangiella sp. IMCC44359 TaxID=3459125 RepID=UPI00403A7D7F
MDKRQHSLTENEPNTVQLSCEECCQNIPYSRESEDYVVYFCGLDCYRKWQEKTQHSDDLPAKKVFVQGKSGQP